ncbi:hypothetical protein SAMN05216266_11527 [Amycolatopsis marina]|uniref:Uncharacterized protein n=1 Tax=Amycolatopsis marina TaxID=490629 RepID=A0A1I1BMV2_9PSEU|nr:hypothetical protein [Amycolatopsis marina]SFB51132.1 hypothetical protein SAMN05216266_11527 [Amycolatopsis marina]
MPIRTNRGRAAVYRKLWGWPLRSPVHLAGTLVVLLAVVVTLGIVIPQLPGGDSGSGPSAATGESSQNEGDSTTGSDESDQDGSKPLPTRLTEPRETPTPDDPDPAALRVAEQWATAWVNHPEGMTVEQWLDGLRPYTTEEYLPVMSTVELANIPATKVAGKATATSAFTSSVEAEVPTDGPTLSLTVVQTNAGWRVAHYDEAG